MDDQYISFNMSFCPIYIYIDDQYIPFNLSFCSMYIYIFLCTHLPCCMIYLFRKNKQVFKLKNDCPCK